jgi:hypothetical protein
VSWQRKVRPGERLRVGAEAYNAFIDAATAHRRGAGAVEGGLHTKHQTTIRVVNVGVDPIRKFEPVPIDTFSTQSGGGQGLSFIREPYQPLVTVGGSANTPETLYSGICVVPQTTLGRNEVGYAVLDGLTWLRVAESASFSIGERFALQRGLAVPSSYGSAVALTGLSLEVVDGNRVILAKIGLPGEKFLARITGSSLIAEGTARWQYEWVEVAVDKDSAVGAPTPFKTIDLGRSHVGRGTALNLYEQASSSGSAYGIPVAGSNFAIGNTGVLFRPVPNNAIVEMARAAAPQGARSEMVFWSPNPVAGPCLPTSGLEDYYDYYSETADIGVGEEFDPILPDYGGSS